MFFIELSSIPTFTTNQFAVALSNMTEEQNSFLAEKLIKRLESVGMRTSYRELYDIFLSKTTNERPIGMVFRRWKNKGSSINGSPRNSNGTTTSMNIRITDEFDWSTDFLQSLSIKCREYEFEKKVPLSGTDDGEEKLETEEDLVLLSFLPRPNVNTSPKDGAMANYLANIFDNLTCGSTACLQTGDSTSSLGKDASPGASDDFLSNRLLCSLVEQSVGLIFLRRSARGVEGRASTATAGAYHGSGFAVVRKAEGSWSAPCFLSVVGRKDNPDDSTGDSTSDGSVSHAAMSADDVKMIVVRKKDLVSNLIVGNVVKFAARKDERANVLVRDAAIICVREGSFQLASDFFLAVKVNDVQNQGAYSLSTDHIEASDILIGEFLLVICYGFVLKEASDMYLFCVFLQEIYLHQNNLSTFMEPCKVWNYPTPCIPIPSYPKCYKSTPKATGSNSCLTNPRQLPAAA